MVKNKVEQPVETPHQLLDNFFQALLPSITNYTIHKDPLESLRSARLLSSINGVFDSFSN
jgi:hypothetical protein